MGKYELSRWGWGRGRRSRGNSPAAFRGGWEGRGCCSLAGIWKIGDFVKGDTPQTEKKHGEGLASFFLLVAARGEETKTKPKTPTPKKDPHPPTQKKKPTNTTTTTVQHTTG